MRYLTVQDLSKLLSTRSDGKVTELQMHHWFILYGKNVTDSEQKEISQEK